MASGAQGRVRPAARLSGSQLPAHVGGRFGAAAGGGALGVDPVRKIADAVLYEGYILWPYRRSALKNSQRWTFGGVYRRAWSAEHEDDRWRMRTQCLLTGDPAGLEV